jgi:hypothetical protein
MKKKLEKKYGEVVKKIAHMLSQNPTEQEALANLRAIPRKERRLVQRFAKKQEKTKNEESNTAENKTVP